MSRKVVPGPITGLNFTIDRTASRHGQKIVWIHGEFGEFGQLPFDEKFLESSDLISIHLPGWGLSTGIELFDKIDELAGAMWWAVEQETSEPVILAGHGLGAAIAVEMAIAQPRATVGLVLSNPFGIFNSDYPGCDIFALMPRDVAGHLYFDTSGPLYLQHFPASDDAYERGLISIKRVEVLGAASRFIFPIPDTNIVRRSYRLAGKKMTILFGEKDGAVPPRLATDWAKSFPQAKIVTVQNTAHMTPYESDSLTDELIVMLGDIGPA